MRRVIDRALRSMAYDVLSRRDHNAGWRAHRAAFLRSSRLSAEALARESDRALGEAVRHAYATSSFYRSAWDAAGVAPGRGFTAADLERLPFLTKEIIRERRDELCSSAFRRDELIQSLTGGTTGSQTPFFLDRRCAVARLGRQWGVFDLCGYRPGMRRGLVWGVHLDLPAADAPFSLKRWFREYATAQETLCCTVLNESILGQYYERLCRFDPEVLYGYPSALAQLARFVRDRKLRPPRVRVIMTTAERLSLAHRRLLAQVFEAEVFNLYCTREYGCVAFECREHAGLHVDTGSVYIEIVRNGRRVPAGVSGEITITDLQNRGMPFIRSRTGDVGTLSPEPCPCGLPQPLLKALDGRSADVVYRPDGSTVAGLMLTDLFADIPSVRAIQYVQQSPAAIDLLVVATDSFSQQDRNAMEREARTILGAEIQLSIRRVPDIPRNPRSGKIQEIVNRVTRRAGQST